jgi:hypothetical protein
MEEQRAYQRVYLPPHAGIYVTSKDPQALGTVRVIGRGGLFFQTTSSFTVGSTLALDLGSQAEHMVHRMDAVVRHVDAMGVGVEFVMPPEAALENVDRLVDEYRPIPKGTPN